MSTAQPTFDDVWRLFQETDRKFQETDRKFQAAERRFQETERLIKEGSRETDLKIKEITRAIGKLGNRLGDFIEDAVRPSAVRLFRERGIDVHEVHQNIEAQRDSGGIEIDLLVVNDKDVVAIECKSNLKMDDVKEHLQRLAKLKKLLPTYGDKRVLGAVAAMVIPDNVADYAYRQGLYVIGQSRRVRAESLRLLESGDHLTIRNDAAFTPAVW